MSITPVYENQANDEVKKDYLKIKQALDLPYLPLFFTYIGAFPNYLNYLTDQLTVVLEHPEFSRLIGELNERIYSLLKSGLFKTEEIDDWLNRYKNSPSFYNFQKDLEKIFAVNIILAFIFIALREALKGWAIAAKQLPSVNTFYTAKKSVGDDKNFIYEDFKTLTLTSKSGPVSNSIQKQSFAIEKDLLPRYIFLCQQEFNQQLKKEEFLIMRVGIEKLLLSSLPLIPAKIQSPINVFFGLTEKYKDFPDLLYLICEYFPTIAVQKMLFSGFMKN